MQLASSNSAKHEKKQQCRISECYTWIQTKGQYCYHKAKWHTLPSTMFCYTTS